MKRVLLPLMAFFGVAFIAAAIALPTYLVPKLKVVPLDLDITSIATTVSTDGEAGDRFPAVIFDRCSVNERRAAQFDAHLTQQRRSVIVEPSNADQATLQSAQTVRIDRVRDADGEERDLTMTTSGELPCDDALLNATVDRVSVNRKTSVPNGVVSSLQIEPVPEGGTWEDASVTLDNRQGFQYKFGFDVQKRDYYYYDTTTRQDSVAKFVDTQKIDGVDTYHFIAEVPEQDLSDLPDVAGDAPLGTILNMPARWWGISGRGVRANDRVELHRYATATRHVYVEPTTGTIIYGYENQHQYFRSPDQSEETPKPIRDFRMDALKGTFAWSDDTVAQQADRAKHYLGLLSWGGTIAPIILGVLGALLLIGCALLMWRGRRGDDEPDAPTDGDDPDNGDGDDDQPSPDDQPTGAYTAPAAAAATTVLTKVSSTDDTTTIPAQQPPADDTPTSVWSQPVPPAYPPADHTASSPADDTETGAFSPIADPTRPMPDYQRHRRQEP